ncbi:MAG: hypothetical protein AAFY28_13025 [Actinomycetota bacterium]
MAVDSGEIADDPTAETPLRERRTRGRAKGQGAGWGTLVRNVVLLALALPTAAFVLIMIGELVPDRLVAESLAEAALDGQLDAVNYEPGLLARQVDGFTDCIGLTVGLGDVAGRNPITSAIAAETLWQCELAVPQLEAWITGEGALERETDYFRYWHGYTAFLRPSIAFFGLPATRVLIMVALVGVTIGLGRSLARTHGTATAALLLTPFVLTSDFVDLPYALPHAFGVLGGLATAWLANAVVSRAVRPWPVIAVSAISGGAVVVLDLLTSAPGLWALCTFVVAAAAARTRTGSPLVGLTVLAAASWIASYAWTWAAKWLISIPVFGFERVRDTIDYTVNNRLSTTPEGFDLGFGNSWSRNLDEWTAQPLTTLVVVGALIAVAAVWWHRRGAGGLEARLVDRLIVGSAALIVPVWFELLRNHSQLHSWFTYRSLPLAFGIVMATAVLPLRAFSRESGVDDDAVDAGAVDGTGVDGSAVDGPGVAP